MNATVFEYPEQPFDLIAPHPAGGYYHVIAFREFDVLGKVSRLPLVIGDKTFLPGMAYTEFGSAKKTSAGYIRYRGAPIVFYGTFMSDDGERHALFTDQKGNPFSVCGYKVCFYSWKYSTEVGAFFSFTHRCAGRVMEF